MKLLLRRKRIAIFSFFNAATVCLASGHTHSTRQLYYIRKNFNVKAVCFSRDTEGMDGVGFLHGALLFPASIVHPVTCGYFCYNQRPAKNRIGMAT